VFSTPGQLHNPITLYDKFGFQKLLSLLVPETLKFDPSFEDITALVE
jgi:hypothetical protein